MLIYFKIKLSPYQHLKLYCFFDIISFCSINSRYLPFLSIFLFTFLVDSPFDCQFVCTPNGTTAEPDYHGRPARSKEKMGGKSFPGCWETIELANQAVENTMAIVF